MGVIEARLQQLGLALPGPMAPPPGVRLPFALVRVRGPRALVSGRATIPTAAWPRHWASSDASSTSSRATAPRG